MINPFFNYFRKHRLTFEQYLFNPFIGRTKKYHGALKIALPAPAEPNLSFVDMVRARQSDPFHKGARLSLEDLSTVLYWSAAELGERENMQEPSQKEIYRPHPSGGAMYPVELYVCGDRIDGLEAGMYHYRPDTHELELVNPMNAEQLFTFKKGFRYPFVQDMGALVVMSFIIERNMPKYGALAYKIGLIEAGHIAQNMYLLAAGLGLKCTALGGMDEEYTNDLIAADGYNECVFYAVALGKETDDKSGESE